MTVAVAVVPMKPHEQLQSDLETTKDPLEIAIDRLKEDIDKYSDEASDENHQAIDELSDQQDCHYTLTVEDAKERVAGMKDYLLSIANTPFSEVLPPPHLECHQAYLLFGGFLHSFKKLETILLGMECFPFPVIEGIMKLLHTIFKAETKPKMGSKLGTRMPFIPLLPEKFFSGL